ncbi:MAG: N-acetyltransferase family protein [Syntrophales bacterium]|jgi:hypothetical protein
MHIVKLINFVKLLSSVERRLALKLLVGEIRRRLYSNEALWGFQFDLTGDFDVPELDSSVTIRALEEGDIPRLLNVEQRGMDETEFRLVVTQRLLAEANLPTCYVGVTKEGQPCCMCWLIRTADSGAFRTYFGNGFPELQPYEVLCEKMFTHRDFRGRRMMRYITMSLFKKAAQEGALRAVAFIRAENAPSLAGARAIGWDPFIQKKILWRLFRRQTILEQAQFLKQKPMEHGKVSATVSVQYISTSTSQRQGR